MIPASALTTVNNNVFVREADLQSMVCDITSPREIETLHHVALDTLARPVFICITSLLSNNYIHYIHTSVKAPLPFGRAVIL